jgi:AraC-like DNA-binding protein
MSFENVLDKMEVMTEPFALCQLRGACTLGLGSQPTATFHYFLAGRGEVVLHDHKSIPVKKDCLVLVPALTSHSLRSFQDGGEPFPQCSASVIELADKILEVEEMAGQSQLVALCTHVTIGLSGIDDLIDLVREPIVERAGSRSEIQTPLQKIIREVLEPGLGSKAMIRVLMLQCMIELLRKRLSAGDQALAWVAALDDQKVWKAVGLMLDAPGDPHSVQSLADAVGMSRSTFAKHFSEAYGTGAMELLRNIRVQRAANLLCETDLPVKRIADIVGFRSRSAFTRMFEKFTGMPPQDYRRR